MKRKVIEILIDQLDDYCHKTKCYECPVYTHDHYCLLDSLDYFKNKPNELMKYLYSLDEGLEVFEE